MELIKQAIKLGNSAGVILPKGWEYRKVKVELIEDSITQSVFEIIKENNLLSDIIGIYLVGSYAREEERPDSDIDILIITGETNRILKKGPYEMLLISKEKADANIKKNLYLYSMAREAKAILNKDLINKYKKERFFLSLSKLNEINSMIKINKESIEIAEKLNKKVRDGVAYSVILRLRELFLIQCILQNKVCTNKEFLKIITEKDSEEVYEAYQRIKNDLKSKNSLKPSKIKNILKYSENILKILKNNYGKKKQKA